MGVYSTVPTDIENAAMNRSARRPAHGSADDNERLTTVTPPLFLYADGVSSWSQSSTKRFFDLFSVLAAFPVVIPICLVVALAVRLTSLGPVLFLQKRMGRYGHTFTILKFRTMMHSGDIRPSAVSTTENQRFTPVGTFLRRWKLDELPQLLNVLVGDMSLVGARPKLPEHQIGDLQCRPGVTGAATLAFAREAVVLARVPAPLLDDYYHEVVLPAKQKLDEEYRARATFFSDLKLLVNSVLRRWDNAALETLLSACEAENNRKRSRAYDLHTASTCMSMPPRVDLSAEEEQAANF